MIHSNSTFVNAASFEEVGDNDAISGDVSEGARSAYVTSCGLWGLRPEETCDVGVLHGLLDHIDRQLRDGSVGRGLDKRAALFKLHWELPEQVAPAMHRRITEVLNRLERDAGQEALRERILMAPQTSFEDNMAMLDDCVRQLRISPDAAAVINFFHAVGRAQNLAGDEDGRGFARMLHAAGEAVQHLRVGHQRSAVSAILNMARRVPDGLVTMQALTLRLAPYR